MENNTFFLQGENVAQLLATTTAVLQYFTRMKRGKAHRANPVSGVVLQIEEGRTKYEQQQVVSTPSYTTAVVTQCNSSIGLRLKPSSRRVSHGIRLTTDGIKIG